MKRSTLSRTLLAAACAAALGAGCGPRITAENYQRITTGMSEGKVGDLLGMPSESRNMTVRVQDTAFTNTQSTWRNDKGTIVVVFLNGEVQSKVYYRPGEEPRPERR